jgi:hypothetical protein
MSGNKHRLHNTDTDNLISNLRGEIGEIIFTWVMMRNFMVDAERLKTSDIIKDIENPQLNILHIMIDKLENELIDRLAELAE